MRPNYKVKLGISNKHIHLSQADLEALFGEGAELTFKKALVQPGQFAAEEQVEIVGAKGSAKVRVLGPVRKATQVELSMTDARTLGIKAPIRESGKLEGTPGLKVIGPKGEVELQEGVIVAKRHVHLSAAQAEEAQAVNGEIVKVVIGEGERKLVFDDVVCRCGDGHEAEMHIDTDEANAACAANDQIVEIIFA
ncbi:MAG: phosphate propanoyltransferase [Clostridia bacterium]|nr:phosphate propanoyltransferase [Clostridia bacterium]